MTREAAGTRRRQFGHSTPSTESPRVWPVALVDIVDIDVVVVVVVVAVVAEALEESAFVGVPNTDEDVASTLLLLLTSLPFLTPCCALSSSWLMSAGAKSTLISVSMTLTDRPGLTSRTSNC